MDIVLVYIHVKPEFIDAFIEVSLENARNSILEPGITRFDLIQEQDDPTRFILIEAYRNPEAASDHKGTDHYARWRDQVGKMMLEPRNGIRYTNLNSDEFWV